MRHADFAMAAAALVAWVAPAQAAHLRDHLESRRITPVVYVGVVAADQQVHERKVGLTAEARIEVLGVVKSAAKETLARARLRYSSWDEKTPPLTGGPQYHLKKGMYVVAFVSSFDDEPAYLISGEKGEVRDFAQKLRDSLAHMTDAQLKFHEINEAGRKAQVEVYDKILTLLGAQ